MNLNDFFIEENASLKEAMYLIEKNKTGLIFAVRKMKLVGSLSDGDIRRHLMLNDMNDSTVSNAMNYDFVFVKSGTPRSVILRYLDNNIKLLPEVDKQGKLVEIHKVDRVPLKIANKRIFHSRSPVRVSFCGGGSDTNAFMLKAKGAVLNATLNLYSNCTLIISEKNEIKIKSSDLNERITVSSLRDLSKHTNKFGLIISIIKLLEPDFGFELDLWSDYPIKSGLGGSAAVVASIIKCFDMAMGLELNRFQISELAYQAERLSFGIPGGWQDQFSTVMGGFNLMEFKSNSTTVHPINIPKDTIKTLEHSLILCDTGIKHDSGKIHDDQKEQLNNEIVFKNIKKNVQLVYKLREKLISGEINQLGLIMDQSWNLKKNIGKAITSKKLDNIYNFAKKNGAIGGKLLGAGGGGFFLFCTNVKDRNFLNYSLRKRGLNIHPFTFESNGLVGWADLEKGF